MTELPQQGSLSPSRRAWQRFLYLTNPLRSGNSYPRVLRDNPLWEALVRMMDPARHWYWRLKNAAHPREPMPISDRGRTVLEDLRRDGIAVQPGFVPEAQLRELLTSSADYARAAQGLDLDSLEPGRQAHFNRMGADLHEDDPVSRFFRSPELVAIAQAHLGFKPRLRRFALFVNQPQPHLEGHLNYEKHFHIDPHDFRVLKLFVYLSDIGPENGPFTYVRGTNFHGRHRGILARLPSGTIETGIMERCVPRGEWLEVNGSAGTAIFAETSGVHRGGRNTAGVRLMLVGEYASHHPWERYDHDIPR